MNEERCETPVISLDPALIPRHVAIIPDGNRRWAENHALKLLQGHSYGVDAVGIAIRTALKLGVRVLTLYGFSTENWRRTEIEVCFLIDLIAKSIRANMEALVSEGVRVSAIGMWRELPDHLVDTIEEIQAATAEGKGLDFVLAINYGGRADIVQAARKLASQAAEGSLDPNSIDEALFSQQLDTAPWPDPDLLIRTSREYRLSNFLMWSSAYTELYFTDKLWPEFSESDFLRAINDYQTRKRRYGA